MTATSLLYRLTRSLRLRMTRRRTARNRDALSREWASLTQPRHRPGCGEHR